MEHYINYPEDFELTEELSNFMNKLLNILTLDLVYLSGRQEEGKSVYYIITAFIDGSMDAIPHEVVCLVQRLEKEFPNFRTRIYTESICESAIGRGSLYFLEHCFLGDKLYSNPEGGTMIDDEERPLKAVLCAAERYHTSERQKVNAFIKSADELIKDRQFGIAVFNLHQAFELTFRFIEHLCLGKSRVTHSIISHIKYCKPFFPNFNLFTNAEHPDNSELIILIEHAYSVARYGDEYQINETQINRIRSEFNAFIKAVEALYNKHLDHCRQWIDGTGNKGDGTLKTEIVDSSPKKDGLILEKINELVDRKMHRLSPGSDKYYYKTEFMLTGLADVLYDIAGIMKVCIIALEYADTGFSRLIPQPHVNIQTALEHILQLIPFEEMECLEEIIKENGLPYEKEEKAIKETEKGS